MPAHFPDSVYGENGEVVLPHSGLRVGVSTLWWQSSAPYDDRPWIAPDIAARLHSDDYAANRDPAVDAALGYELVPAHAVEYPDRLTVQLRRNDLRLSRDEHGPLIAPEERGGR